MGRGSKTVVAKNGLDRRVIGHYQSPPEVATYIASEVRKINPDGRLVLDPCMGTGTLLQPFADAGVETHGMDIIDWRDKPVDSFTETDFLREFSESEGLFGSDRFQAYDYFVLNPPYNCHESDYVRDNKDWLSRTFSDVGIANIYAMFIAAVIRAARPGAVMGVLTLDSFMTARLHEPLRKLITESCAVHNITLCPADLFRSQRAEVRTCVIVLEKLEYSSPAMDHTVRVLDRSPNSREFFSRLQSPLNETPSSAIALTDKRDRAELVVGVPQDILRLFEGPRLGEEFSCITGISTGSDGKYLRSQREDGYSVPFYKNPASKRFWMVPDGYLIDHYVAESYEVKNFMVRNRSSYDQPGISCSSMGVPFAAVYRPAGTTFGVNPNILCPEGDIWWLLAYLNSSLVTYLVRGVLLRTNMVTSGYIARLPVPSISTATKEVLGKLAKEAAEGQFDTKQSLEIRDQIDAELARDLSLSKTSLEKLREFNADLLSHV